MQTNNDFIQLFIDRKIIISSAFYLVEIWKKGILAQRIFFLPKIYGKIQPKKSQRHEIAHKKEVKKIKFLSLPVFKEMVRQIYKEHDEIKFDIDFKPLAKLHGQFVISSDEEQILRSSEVTEYQSQSITPYYSMETPKVSLQTASDEEEKAGPFYQTDVKLYFEKRQSAQWQTHFYFLFQSQMTSLEEKRFLSSLKLLADEGIGGERTTGAGWFEGIEKFLSSWDNPHQIINDFVRRIQSQETQARNQYNIFYSNELRRYHF